jgi:hypothetical protein
LGGLVGGQQDSDGVLVLGLQLVEEG